MSSVAALGERSGKHAPGFLPMLSVPCACPSADGAVYPFIVISPGPEQDHLLNPVR